MLTIMLEDVLGSFGVHSIKRVDLGCICIAGMNSTGSDCSTRFHFKKSNILVNYSGNLINIQIMMKLKC